MRSDFILRHGGQEGENADKNGGVYASDDGGKTWRALFTESQHVYDLTIDTHHPDTLYICGFDAAAFRSTDRGATGNASRATTSSGAIA